MAFTFTINCVPKFSRRLYNIQIFNNSNKLGKVNFMINNNNNATINNLEICNDYKRQGYGTLILLNVESFVKKTHDVNKIDLVAWQSSGNTDVCDFFKKNGYNEEIVKNPYVFDDSIVIYDLYKMYKNL